jgi:hypothetical protein
VPQAAKKTEGLPLSSMMNSRRFIVLFNHLVGTSAMLNSVSGGVLFWIPKEQAPASRGFEVTRPFSRSYNIKPQ